jgi:hypothetical protein
MSACYFSLLETQIFLLYYDNIFRLKLYIAINQSINYLRYQIYPSEKLLCAGKNFHLVQNPSANASVWSCCPEPSGSSVCDV